MEQTSSAAYPNVLVADYVKKARVANPQILMKAEQHLNVGLGVSEPGLDIGLQCAHDLFRQTTHKKSGHAPTSGTSPGSIPGAKLWRQISTGVRPLSQIPEL